jgi:hypothetical protein
MPLKSHFYFSATLAETDDDNTFLLSREPAYDQFGIVFHSPKALDIDDFNSSSGFFNQTDNSLAVSPRVRVISVERARHQSKKRITPDLNFRRRARNLFKKPSIRGPPQQPIIDDRSCQIDPFLCGQFGNRCHVEVIDLYESRVFCGSLKEFAICFAELFARISALHFPSGERAWRK